MKVLVVDDEPALRALMREVLEELGHEPVLAVSSMAASRRSTCSRSASSSPTGYETRVVPELGSTDPPDQR